MDKIVVSNVLSKVYSNSYFCHIVIFFVETIAMKFHFHIKYFSKCTSILLIIFSVSFNFILVFYVFRYELSEEVRESCNVLATYLVDSTQVQTKELVSIEYSSQKKTFKFVTPFHEIFSRILILLTVTYWIFDSISY